MRFVVLWMEQAPAREVAPAGPEKGAIMAEYFKR
jgi:hypothetical protein